MTTITLWLLISAGNSRSAPIVLERFATEAECAATANMLHQRTRDMDGATLRGVCVRATVLRDAKP